MTVLVDLSILATSARRWGIGRYVESLARGFASRDSGLQFLVDASRDEVVDDPLVARARLLGRSVGRYRWAYGLRLGLDRAARRIGATVVHLPHVEATPLGLCARRVVTAHDLIPHTQVGYAGVRDGWGLGRRWLDRRRYGAEHVIAVSESTMRDLRAFGVSAPITVVSHGTDWTEEASSRPQASPYVLVVGDADPRKRLDWCMDALAQTDVELIWVGGLSPSRRLRVLAAAQARGLRDRVQLWGRVTDRQLRRLYRHAVALWMPSRAEGFGFPVLEAMACGAPVIIAPTRALLEVGADAVAVAHSPAAMAALTTEWRQRRPEERLRAGHRRAQALSLRRQIEATRAVYEATQG